MGAPSTKRFTIRRQLGEGGMGVVYEAFDEERRAAVALKTLNRFDGNALARFKREFRALQGLAHPNLVALDELFFDSDQWFFTMELLDGVDFVSHVTGRQGAVPFQSTVRESAGKITARPPALPSADGTGAPFDEQRLRDALRQLLEGLSALHAVDKVHRDVKPSNVLVTREGRVVLLDFGLVTEASVEDRSTGSAVVGTPAYMAPEQAASREVGPAADLYAVGVMLYEVLTGRLPIDGPQLQVLIEKQTREPSPPSSLVAGVPADLDVLCARLLRFDPVKRPSAAETLQLLARGELSGSLAPRASTEAPIFVGRSEELAELRAAFDVSASGQLATVLVCGESGIGKSHLVRRITGQLLAEHPEALLLEGRCYERESVPYKTLDGIVDALSRRLSRMPAADVAGLLPMRSAALAEVFPVMLRIPQVAKQHAALTIAHEAQELRQRAFGALRDMFTRVALRRPTILVIDDLQWADDDGLRALAEILRPPDAPPLLLLGTVRVVPGGADARLNRVRAAMPAEPRVLALVRLGHEEARELAAAALRRTGAREADPEVIASEAAGHPLFVEELVRHIALVGSTPADSAVAVSPPSGSHKMAKLDDAIWSRVLQLEPATREMAELIAIAGRPIPQEVAAAAARIEPGEFNRRAATLRASYLVRTGGARWADAIEPYHDRVREAVLAQLGPERRRELHEALAVAFEASSHDDPETLAMHWREAGNASRAARHAAAAGDLAAKTLAFDRAARWYEEALGLLSEGDPAHRELRVKVGDALANAGRGALAASYFESAAADSSAVDALELRRRAAEQLLRAGEVHRGMEATRTVLGALGLKLPRTALAAIVSLLWLRLLLRLRGYGFVPREAKEIPPAELARIDVCWSVACSLAYADPFFGGLFQARHLILALRAGERLRITRALAIEGGFAGAEGPSGWPRAERMLRLARQAARGSTDPYVEAIVLAGEGVASVMSFQYARGIDLLEQAVTTFRERCPGSRWEVSTMRYFSFLAQHFSNRYPALHDAIEAALKEAVDTGDRYAAVMFRVSATNRSWLLAGDPARARSELEAGLREWPAAPFHTVHYYALVSETYIDLYEGHPERAAARLEATRRSLRRSLILELEGPRLEYTALTGGIGLSIALSASLAGRPVDLRAVDRSIRALARHTNHAILETMLSLRAGRAAVLGNRDETLARLVEIGQLGSAEGWLAAQCARWAAGKMRGGEGEAQANDAEAELASRGIRVARGLVAAQMPGVERYL